MRTSCRPSLLDCWPTQYGPYPGSGCGGNHPLSSSSQRHPPPACGGAGSPRSRQAASCDRRWPSTASSVRHAGSPAAPGCPTRIPGCRSRGRLPVCEGGSSVPEGDYRHCFNLVDIGGRRANGEGSYNGVVVTIKEDPRRGLHPSACRPRRPTGPAPNAGLVPGGATEPMPATW